MIYPSNISNEELNALDLDHFQGEIVVASERNEVIRIMEEVWKERVVGFDTETKPSFRKGVRHDVSLVQIATREHAYLIRLNHTGLTREMRDLFRTDEITKVGVALRDDIKDLRKLSEFDPAGFVELNKLVKDIGIESNGLKKLTGIILGFRISKNAQTSNWENDILTEKQLTYAATDAWVCIEMYHRLHEQGLLAQIR
jgi:ribonuclease D